MSGRRVSIGVADLVYDLVRPGWSDADTLGAVDELEAIEHDAITAAEVEVHLRDLLRRVSGAYSRVTLMLIGDQRDELRQALRDVESAVAVGIAALDAGPEAMADAVRQIDTVVDRLVELRARGA